MGISVSQHLRVLWTDVYGDGDRHHGLLFGVHDTLGIVIDEQGTLRWVSFDQLQVEMHYDADKDDWFDDFPPEPIPYDGMLNFVQEVAGETSGEGPYPPDVDADDADDSDSEGH